MPNITVRAKTPIARPLKVLVPLIKQELDAGNEVGLPHYRRAGEMLLEAKEQMPYGHWGRWLSKNFTLSQQTARHYMRVAQHLEEDDQAPNATSIPRFRSVRGLLGRHEASAHISWRPVLKAARDLDAELFAQERQTREDEVRLHRELAIELIDLGYRALATRLHPDRGGSKDAMVRLNRIRDELKTVAETRRFV